MDKLSPDDLVKYNILRNKLSTTASKIKSIVEQGRSVNTDSSQLFLFKGMHKELKPSYDVYVQTWDKAIEFFYTLGISDVFPSEKEKGQQQAVDRYYYEANAIYEHYMNPTPVKPVASHPVVDESKSSHNESRAVRARLPQINIPQFSGNPMEWPLFRDTYISLIHNEPTLSNMEKFLFLMSSLKGTARTLVGTVTLEEANYDQAWKLLLEHYNDKRRLAINYLKQVLDFKPFTSKPTAVSLKYLLTTVIEAIDSFKQLNIPRADDFILSHLVLRCLDPATKRSFEKEHTKVEFPSYKDVTDFLKAEWRSMDLSASEDFGPHSYSRNGQHFKSPNSDRHSKNSLFVGHDVVPQRSSVPSSSHKSQGSGTKSLKGQKSVCPICNIPHTLYQCNKFRKASAAEKSSLLKGWTGCFNCLSSKHISRKCPSMRRCQYCNGSHHSWLHVENNQEHQTCTSGDNKPQVGNVLGSISHSGNVLLGTAVVEVKDSHDMFMSVRVVTDSGSQYSFMTEKCARRLGLEIEPSEQRISGIGQVHLSNIIGRVTCSIRSRLESFNKSPLTTHAVVVSKITSDLPQVEIPYSTRVAYSSYVLADPDFSTPGPVEMLLGGDLFFDFVMGRPVVIHADIPRLLPTLFGFVVAGPSKFPLATTEGSSFLTTSQEELNDLISRFWHVEEVTNVSIQSADADICEKHFEETHYRLDTGRYVVSLPVKKSIATLGNPKGQAFRRLTNLESKLQRDDLLRKEYTQFMDEYFSLGHMKLVSPGTSRFILPHHAVIKWQDGKIKLRTVFDGSCKTPTGSLNDHLYIGPKLQLDIREIITNFRIHQFVLTADIVKMYRQILVHPQDRSYQHILWRADPAESVKEYELCTVTYGLSPAPFLAQRTIIQLVKDEGAPFPLASQALREDIYVDDIATGADTLERALKLKEELIQLLAKGGFQLSKWASNNSELLPRRTVADEQSAVCLSAEEEPKVKLLGMQWIPSKDIFTYELCQPDWHPSKRAILSAIARIYDPLGFLSPAVFYAKTILQEVWLAKCDWDDLAPSDITKKWHSFLSQLSTLSQVCIPRWISPGNTPTAMIIGFCDASKRGYAAVIYLRFSSISGIRTYLVKAKTKLSPMKPLTINRLELLGAVLLCRLFQSCELLMTRLDIQEARFFTDSEVVLSWLSISPHKLTTFVAHRVVKILEMTNVSQWHYVQSESNPADCGSRGILPSQLCNHPLWWAGPPWLNSDPDSWPKASRFVEDPSEMKEATGTSLAVTTSPSNFIEWMGRFSSYSRLLHSAAYILRFISRLKKGAVPQGFVTVPELRAARTLCIKLSQEHYKLDSKLLQRLRAFVGDDGILRVGGRLQYSSLPYDAKHPILLSNKNPLSCLLVDHLHKVHLHLGPTSLQSVIQQQFWIVSARRLVRQRVFNCIKCYKANRSPRPPVMGNLPSFRLEEGRAFKHVGVDFGGPFTIRESLRRKAAQGKSYLCLFICMSTRAVHLEVVSKCSTEAFLAAFNRFISRRGKPTHMYSDCGTNFIGAANQLREVLLWLRNKSTQDDIRQNSAAQEIEWSFNPPSAPHFGGIWEAGIKSAKTLLHKVVGDTILTFEELTTLFCRIEAILNSRPLTPLSPDPEGLECLTPGHFLVGRPLTAPPEEDLRVEKISPLKRWHIVQQRSQYFWNRWRHEYLNHLQQRKRWTSEGDRLKEGDLVIIKDPTCPQRTWPLARVLQTHPGKDGVVRVVTIRTQSGIYKRPAAKLVPLIPVNDQDL